MDERDKLLRKARKTKNKEDWNLHKKSNNLFTKKLRTAKRNYHQNLLNENSNNPSGFWNAIKEIFLSKCKTNIKTNNSISANLFGAYFCTAANLLRGACKTTICTWRLRGYYNLRTNETFKFKYVSIIFIKKQLKSLKRKKSSGLDHLPPGLLKDCADEIAEPLHHIINLSLNCSTFPLIWKETKIIPLFKSDYVHNPIDYRPISVLAVLSKILERSAHTQLIVYWKVIIFCRQINLDNEKIDLQS